MSGYGLAHRPRISYGSPRAKWRHPGPAPSDVWPSACRTASVALIALMASVSVALWTALPLAVLWLASKLSGAGSGLSALAALTLVAGIPLSMALGTLALARLNGLYLRVSDGTTARSVPSWRRAISDSGSRPAPSALDTIMVASVLAAVLALAIAIVFTQAPTPLI